MVKLATLALGLAFATIPSASFAQSNHANRAQAIQDCNAAAGKYSEHLWGSVSRQMYRTCMADRGERE